MSSEPLSDTQLMQFGEDIWITDKPLAPHRDNTKAGMLTYGLVLLNTGYTMVYSGKLFNIPTGALYVIDGRLEHATEGSGLLVLLIWDMPNWTIMDFMGELMKDDRVRNLSHLFTIAKEIN